jgi:hypothetical protein
MLKDLRETCTPFGNIELDPTHDCTKNLFLRSYIQLITGNDIDELTDGKEEKLLTAHHFLEIVLCEHIRDSEQLTTGVCVSKGPDSQTIRWVQLTLEKLTTLLLNLVQLEQAS